MPPIEQAREALTPSWLSNCCVCGRIVDTRESHQGGDAYGCELNDGRWTCSEPCWSSIVDPSTPVDGVGAEPVAWAYRQQVHDSMGGWESRITPFDPRKSSWIKAGDLQDVRPLYAAPLAHPEAEARLRERVAAATDVIEELKFALFASSMPIKDRADQSARLFLEAAAARLAQAEGGPAVTEALTLARPHVVAAAADRISGASKALTAIDKVLQAALHPQSAAGEADNG